MLDVQKIRARVDKLRMAYKNYNTMLASDFTLTLHDFQKHAYDDVQLLLETVEHFQNKVCPHVTKSNSDFDECLACRKVVPVKEKTRA